MTFNILSQHTQTDSFECDSCGDTFEPTQIGRDLSAPNGEVIIWCESCVEGDDFTFEMRDLVAAFTAINIEAHVDMTGGGVATMFVGEVVGRDEFEGTRRVAAIGPGEYLNGDDALGYWGELFIGPDTDDDQGGGGYWRGVCDVNAVAAYVAAHMDEYRAQVRDLVSLNA